MALQDGRAPGTDAYDERMRRIKRQRPSARAAALAKHRKANRRALQPGSPTATSNSRTERPRS